LAASWAGSPVQPPPWGIDPAWIRINAHSPFVLPAQTPDDSWVSLWLLKLRPALPFPEVWQGAHFCVRIGLMSAA
jgi:hypothetical protein